jgi:AraC-like DNA-binding protein
LAEVTPEKLGVVDYVRAVVRYREKKFDEAIRYAEEGIASAAAKRDFANTSKNMNVLYHTYKTTGHPDKALHYLEQITVLQDSLLKKELQEQAVMYQIKYETYTRDEQLRTEKQISRNRLLRLWFAGTAAVVLMLFSGFLVILYRQKDAAYWGLYQQIKEQDRLADELKQVSSQYEALEQSIARQTAENTPADAPVTPAGALAEQPAGADSPAQPPDDDIRQRKLVDALREYILDNSHIVMADIDRNRLAVALSTNRTTLSGAVKAITGKTLMEYVHFLRLEETRKMLDSHKRLSIDAIAENYGLNARTFYRLFREHYKISPAEYRKMAKKMKAELTI